MTRSTTDLNLSREALVSLVAKTVLAATGFLGVVVFARVLGVDGLGKYYFLLALAKFGTQVPSGINSAIQKRVSEVGVDVPEYFGLGLLLSGGYTALLAVGAAVIYPFVRGYVGPSIFLVATIVTLGSLALFSLCNRIYAGVGHPSGSFWVDTVRSILTLGLQFLALWLGYHVLGLLVALVTATLLSTALVFVLAPLRPAVPSRTTFDRHFSFARWSVPNTLLQNMYSRLDVVLLYLIIGSSAVGLYEPALRLTIPASIVATAIGEPLNVKASGLSSIGRDVLRDLEHALSYACLFAIPMIAGALALGPELMGTVFGPGYRAGATALVGLSIFQFLNCFRTPFDNILSGIDRPELQFRVSFLTLLVNAPLAVVLGFEYGLLGVVAATIIAEFVRTVAYLIVAWRLFDTVLLPRPLVHQGASALVMFVVVFSVHMTFDVSGWARLLPVVGLGAAIYFAVLLAVSGPFRFTVRSAVNGLLDDWRSGDVDG